MRGRLTLVILSLLGYYLGYGGTPKLLLGVWHIDQIMIHGATLNHEDIGKPMIEFNRNGGFLTHVGGQQEKGKFHVQDSTLALQFIIPKKPNQIYTITRLDKSRLEYHYSDSLHQITKVTCTKIAPAYSEREEREHEKMERKKRQIPNK